MCKFLFYLLFTYRKGSCRLLLKRGHVGTGGVNKILQHTEGYYFLLQGDPPEGIRLGDQFLLDPKKEIGTNTGGVVAFGLRTEFYLNHSTARKKIDWKMFVYRILRDAFTLDSFLEDEWRGSSQLNQCWYSPKRLCPAHLMVCLVITRGQYKASMFKCQSKTRCPKWWCPTHLIQNCAHLIWLVMFRYLVKRRQVVGVGVQELEQVVGVNGFRCCGNGVDEELFDIQEYQDD